MNKIREESMYKKESFNNVYVEEDLKTVEEIKDKYNINVNNTIKDTNIELGDMLEWDDI